MRLKILLLVVTATVLFTILLHSMGVDAALAFWVCGAAFSLVGSVAILLVPSEMEVLYESLLFTGCGQPAIWALEVYGPLRDPVLKPMLRNLENTASGCFEPPPCGSMVADSDWDFEYYICRECLADESTLPIELRRFI